MFFVHKHKNGQGRIALSNGGNQDRSGTAIVEHWLARIDEFNILMIGKSTVDAAMGRLCTLTTRPLRRKSNLLVAFVLAFGSVRIATTRQPAQLHGSERYNAPGDCLRYFFKRPRFIAITIKSM